MDSSDESEEINLIEEEEKDGIPLEKLRHELSLQLSRNSMSPSVRLFLEKLDKEMQCRTMDIMSFSNVEHFEKEFFLHCVTVALTENEDTTNLAEREKPLMINGIRIQPGCMVFKDAYDGKRFKQALTITNCGKHSVNIRIYPPTSKAFQIKAMPIGHTLTAGLSIVKHITYTYTKPTAIPQASMDIFINNEYLRYQLLVFTCYTQVKVSPKLIDFGEIDLGTVSDQQKITVTNTGTKQAHYATDLGRNPLEIIVEPTKGTVQPGETKEMSVEVFGENEGEFNQEFWIKTDPLQRVHIQGQFIQPSLRVDYPFNDKNFLIMTFPKTFVGIRQQKSVVIQNFSSTPAVFCVNGRTKDEKLPYKAAAKKDVNFRQFQIVPLEGRLQRDQKYIMRVMLSITYFDASSYTPAKLNRQTTYYICHVVVDVMKCRTDRNPFCPQRSNNIEAQQSVSQVVTTLNSLSVLTAEEDPYDQPHKIPVLDDMISILLYGEVELPEVTLQPDKLYLRNLKIYETHVETVNILNKSTSLPLVARYNKAANIELQPSTIQLPPNKSIQVVLKVRPTKMGSDLIKVSFDLLYKQKETLIKLTTAHMEIDYSAEYSENQKYSRKTKPVFLPGITPKNCHEVGYLVDDVRFNTKIEKPSAAIVDKKYLVFDKDNDALIAFPNDRPKALRPWRNHTPCKTIFAQLPRLITDVDVDYDLTPNEQRLKDATESYYLKYIRSLAKKNHPVNSDEEFEDYTTTNPKRIFLECVKRGELPPSLLDNASANESLFVPLTPYQVHNTVVSPKFIQLGRLAANTECSDHFSVDNKNNFPIHISIKALYPSIKIVQEAFILGPNSQKDIDFTYHSDSSGTHHIPMFIIMNFFHVLEVTILAKIVANTVKCVTKDITIVPTEKTAFLELENPINSDVAFEVDTNFFHLESFPSKGVIPAKRNMVLTITFNPEVGYTPLKEIAVVSESGAKELVEVRFDHKKASVLLSSETLTFKDMPLNTSVTQQLYIVNNSDQLIPLNVEVDGEEAIPELEVTPMRALILQKGDIIVNFTLKYNQIVNFNIQVNLIFQYEYTRQITVSGNVVYPSISFRPDLIKIPKIPSGSTVTTPFRVINNNEVNNYLQFHMEDYPEFSILNKFGQDITEGMLTLAPKERLDLFLEFHPHEPVAYCIYLPYILNGVLGPPELNCPDTLLFGYYLKATPSELLRGGVEKLKVLKILCAARKKFLKFSSLHLEFCTFETTCHSFVITNVDSAPHEVSLKVTKEKSFQISAASDDTVEEDEDVIRTWLNPDESCTLIIDFIPSTCGIFNVDIPIYVKDHSVTQPFNYLKLTGYNHEPQIASSQKSIYFTPIYAGSRQTKNIEVYLIAHRCNKMLDVSYEHCEVEVLLVGQEAVSELKTVVRYVVVFAPKEDCEIETAVKFSCPCCSSTIVDVFACSHKSLVINFMSDPSIVHDSTYPLFPATDNQSDYAILLRTIVGIIERWLYTQGYFYRSFYRIPDDIACYPVEIAEKDKSKSYGKKTHALLPLVQLIINLMDRSVLKYIDCGIQPSQELSKRTIYNYVTYRNTVSFLKSQGIHVPGLKPEYLLTFIEYTEYKKNIAEERSQPDKEDFDEGTFYRFSKQMWLDLFFHIYKNLVLERIVDPKTSPPMKDENDFIETDKRNFDRYLKTNLPRFPNWYLCDAKLILWLEYHYNRQKSILWPNEKFEAVHHLKDLSDVDDSVSLAAVTAAYCPYLTYHLKDIYPVPKNLEQKVHNACRVVQSWKSLKLSFDVHPHTIVSANTIKIIFIVTYLYEVLPHFYPTNSVRIEAPLSESATYSLSVQNCGNVPIQYIAIFFGESSSLFKLDCSSIIIPGGKTSTLKLTYYARRVLDASAILVLTGEAGGHRYAKSMAVAVTGAPVTTSSDEIKLQVETYKSIKKKIQLKSPYGRNYRAKIFICFKQPESYKDLHAISSLKESCIPREVDVVASDCEFGDKGVATIILSICFVTQGQERLYLYFCNADIGDFCVLVNIISIWNKNKAEIIKVDLPQHVKTVCKCKRGFNRSCPQVFTVNVPYRNKLMLKSTETLLLKCFTGGSHKLIRSFFGTPILIRILKFYLERFPQGCMLPSYIFDDQAEFMVSPSKNFSAPNELVKISDVTSDQTVPLMLHWDQSSRPTNAYLELKNMNEKEIRLYQLVFPTVHVSIGTDNSQHTLSSIGNKSINKP